eukprot:CAMPEP_0177609372 /NCGR_PEP_ID=MMETSP0419_2-20121207/19044_1 /TAXON_ID=582737 /ORGANISM="Tetraselmis sp., Strain GSL018" /LENGTH=92 /DNA_ID=CAMNT_0019104273 /DNA_START=122 /DNA_END=401 /DNA_ORIENTATION=-
MLGDGPPPLASAHRPDGRQSAVDAEGLPGDEGVGGTEEELERRCDLLGLTDAPEGVKTDEALSAASLEVILADSGVRIIPGATQFTRMFFGA